jgi:hypothetical protein
VRYAFFPTARAVPAADDQVVVEDVTEVVEIVLIAASENYLRQMGQ